LATCTCPSGTGCNGSSGVCRSTAAVHKRISCRTVGLSAALAGSPSAPTTSCSGVARSEYANPSVTTPYTTRPAPCSPRPAPSTLTIAPIPMLVSFAVQKWNWCGVARFHPQQSVQEVVPLPRPQPEIPGVDCAARAAAFRPEHAGAVDRGQGQRALELRALEVLGAVTFDDAHRAGVRGQRGRIGEHPVHDQPFVGAEPRELPP